MLRNRWYPILEARRLGRRPVGVKRLGQELVVFRGSGGQVVVQGGFCPHRGAGLAGGRVIDGELVCPWHGFRFADDGHCTLMPCEGGETRPPKALSLPTFQAREERGLVWLWWGERQTELPPIPFFDEVGPERGDWTESSYELPYHYTRMVETNLDIHHTPFVHGSVVPVGSRVEGFDAKLEGDRISTGGSLVKEGRSAGSPFRADLILPCLGLVQLTPKLHILVSATPVDEGRTWLWFRYYQSYTSLRPLGKLLTWLAVHSELRVVQRQDWRIFAAMTPGTIDDFPYAFVHADKGIALYRKRRTELLQDTSRAAAG